MLFTLFVHWQLLRMWTVIKPITPTCHWWICFVCFVFNLCSIRVMQQLKRSYCPPYAIFCATVKSWYFGVGETFPYILCLIPSKYSFFVLLAIHLNRNCVHKLVKHSIPRWGLLKLRSLITPLRQISIYQNNRLDDLNHVHIWLVSPQLSCGDI